MPSKSELHPLIFSIHALLAESDLHCKTFITFRHFFYPRSPCGERPRNTKNNCIDYCFSIHALLAESDFRLFFIIFNLFTFLSTLSLRRATLNPPKPRRFHYLFYPRSPCGERHADHAQDILTAFFLSTLSLRRATKCHTGHTKTAYFSIHALLAESDTWALQS